MPTREVEVTNPSGKSKAGPSKAYLRLLEGKTSSQQYTKTVKRAVERELGLVQERSGAKKR